jgi:ABC-type branched-subunit amino acid transport system substrate-binding protein
MLAAKRPDIQIVGDELISLGKVKDFAPYVTKIRASGADGVLTGNWGNDLLLLIKASNESCQRGSKSACFWEWPKFRRGICMSGSANGLFL